MATNVQKTTGAKTRTLLNNTGAAVESGDIVALGGILWVALGDVANDASGEFMTGCQVEAPKVSAADITANDLVIWDSSADEFDDSAATPATGDVQNAAIALETKGAATTTIVVELTGQIGDVT